jgi:uncharacterized membrane protein YqjE
MTVGAALALIAVGAILKWAVTAQISWLNLRTTGTVLFVIGLIGLIVALFYAFWTPTRDRREETRVMPPRDPNR